MSAIANILIKDDANPLVEATLVPIASKIPTWRSQATGVPDAGQTMLQQLAKAKLPSGAERRVMKLEVPVMETLGASGTSAGYVAPQKVAFVIPFTVTALVDSRATPALLANGYKYLLGVLAGASATTATGTLNGASAADAVKNSTAMAPRFFCYGEDAY